MRMGLSINMMLCLLSILALIFAIYSILAPWWSVSTSKAIELYNGTKISAEYFLMQKIKVYEKTSENISTKVLSLENITHMSSTSVGWLKALNSMTLNIMTASIAINGVALIVLLLFNLFKGMKSQTAVRITSYIHLVAAISVLIAAFYYASEIGGVISQFTNAIPEASTSPSGKMISGFWGSSESGLTWCWGPAAGWFSAFAALLLNGISAYLIRQIGSEKFGVSVSQIEEMR